jgi:hypothetical protein
LILPSATACAWHVVERGRDVEREREKERVSALFHCLSNIVFDFNQRERNKARARESQSQDIINREPRILEPDHSSKRVRI